MDVNLVIMVVNGMSIIGGSGVNEFSYPVILNPRIISYVDVPVRDSRGSTVILPNGETKVNTLIKMTPMLGFPTEIPMDPKCLSYNVNPNDKDTIALYKRLTTPMNDSKIPSPGN